MFTKKDREMLDHNTQRIEHLDYSYDCIDKYLEKKFDDLLERARKAESENISLRIKVDLYEKYIQSIKDANANSIDTAVCMFDGELYVLRNYDISKQEENVKKLSADFDCLTGVTKNFKGE